MRNTLGAGVMALYPQQCRHAPLALVAALVFLPAGESSAAVFSRDPSLDNLWTYIGNSNTQATTTLGGWAGQSTTASFDIYFRKFTLAGDDTIGAPSSGAATGDCYLASTGALAAGCTAQVKVSGSNWVAGNSIVAFGLKWTGSQKGSFVSSAAYFNLDPIGSSGFMAGTAYSSPGTYDFTNYSSPGSINFNIWPDAKTQNRSPYETYRINPIGGGAIISPYGALAANGNNRSTIAQEDNTNNTPNGSLPVRTFGNSLDNNTQWEYLTVYLNETLMNANYGQPLFTDNYKWAIIARQWSDPDQSIYVTAASPVPGPLPLLGLGATVAWSRRIRKRLKARQ